MGEEKKKKRGRDEEIIEVALVSAGAALAISAIKKLFAPLLLNQSPLLSLLDSPPPFLFLLLNIVIASIVIVSIQPMNKKGKKRIRKRREIKVISDQSNNCVRENEKEKKEGEVDGDTEELNRRVEAFILAFRHQLRVDSFSSQNQRTTAIAA